MPRLPPDKIEKSDLESFLDSLQQRPEIASGADEIAAADFVVCVLADDAEKRERFPDNVIADCCKCGIPVQLRPDVPPQPARICYRCAAKLGLDNIKPMISAKTAFNIWLRGGKV